MPHFFTYEVCRSESSTPHEASQKSSGIDTRPLKLATNDLQQHPPRFFHMYHCCGMASTPYLIYQKYGHRVKTILSRESTRSRCNKQEFVTPASLLRLETRVGPPLRAGRATAHIISAVLNSCVGITAPLFLWTILFEQPPATFEFRYLVSTPS